MRIPSYNDITAEIDILLEENARLAEERDRLTEAVDSSLLLELDMKEEWCEQLDEFFEKKICRNRAMIDDMEENRYRLYEDRALYS